MKTTTYICEYIGDPCPSNAALLITRKDTGEQYYRCGWHGRLVVEALQAARIEATVVSRRGRDA